jgi:hypothetical protein
MTSGSFTEAEDSHSEADPSGGHLAHTLSTGRLKMPETRARLHTLGEQRITLVKPTRARPHALPRPSLQRSTGPPAELAIQRPQSRNRPPIFVVQHARADHAFKEAPKSHA